MYVFFLLSLLGMLSLKASDSFVFADPDAAAVVQHLLSGDNKKRSASVAIPLKRQSSNNGSLSKSVPKSSSKVPNTDPVLVTPQRISWSDHSSHGRPHGSRPPTPSDLDPSCQQINQSFE